MGGFKRGLAVVVTALAVLAVALGLATPALAATITVEQPEEDHAYTAYQILKGDVTNPNKISNVQWGDDVNGAQLLSLLRSSSVSVYAATDNGGQKKNTTVGTVFASASTAEDFAAVFDWASDNAALAQAVAQIIDANTSTVLTGSGTQATYANSEYTFNITNHGYYYIKDSGSKAASVSVFMQVFDDVDKEIAAKGATPTLEKKVYENVSYTANDGYGAGYNDTADYSIGDSVPFKLIGSIPDMSAYNNGYQYTINDTLSTSLNTPISDNVKVYAAVAKDSDLSGSDAYEVTSQFTVTVSGQTITIVPNITASANKLSGTNDLSAVVVKEVDGENNTTLDANGHGGYNYIIVTYSAKLNINAALGQQTIEGNTVGGSDNRGNVNKANLTYSTNPSSFGEGHQANTPDDYVIVFTYGTDLTKVSAANMSTALQGVTFHLYRKASDNSKVYAQVDSSTHKLIAWTNDSNAALILLTSDSDGKIQVLGLDAGTYYVEEVNNPNDGYNTPSQPWEIVITASTSNSQTGEGATNELTSLTGAITNSSYESAVAFLNQGTAKTNLVSGSVSASTSTGLVTATITNTQGFELPQTGGAGTIAITVAGVVLVAGAVITLTIRRRANDER